MGSMVLFGRLKHMASRLIFALTVCALLEAFANVFSVGVYGNEIPESGECYFQGFLLQFSQIAIFGWITVIATNLYLVVVQSRNTANYEIVYHVSVWVVAVILTLIPLADSVYGPAGVWCWMKRTPWQYRVATFYGPLYVMMMTVIILYGLILRTVRKHFKEEGGQNEQTGKLLLRLRVYPIVFVACYLFPTINRIYETVETKNSSFPLYLLQGGSAASLGFVNAVVYGFDVDMRRLWKNYLYNKGICMTWTQPSSNAELESSSVDFE